MHQARHIKHHGNPCHPRRTRKKKADRLERSANSLRKS